MSNKCSPLSTLKSGRDDYRIKVRILRKWRGISKKGEDFKKFNILLLDNKNTTIHAFIPTMAAYDLERKIVVGTVNIISGFTVEPYKESEKFRCVRAANQLLFSKDTKIQQIEETGTNIPTEKFDFYDHTELRPLADQTTYLIDVIGIIRDREILLDTITNRHGQQQEQAKFEISDGTSTVKVTFWDKYAQKFVNDVWQNMETPVIIILAACRVQLWNGDVNLTHVAGTKYYFNFNHHSVQHLRRMLSDPQFSQKVQSSKQPTKAELLPVEAITALGPDFIERQVLSHVHIIHVDEKQKWYIIVCTTCDLETPIVDDFFYCMTCQRIVPHPEIRFRLVVIASDQTGSIELVLHDREIRSLVGKRARQFLPKQTTVETLPTFFPDCFKLMAKQPYTVKLEINESNVLNKARMYWVTNICHGFKLEETEPQVQETISAQTTEATKSTVHLQGMSDLNCQSSTVTPQ